MRLLIELSTASPDDNVPELWEAMKHDADMDRPRHRLTLESKLYAANVRVIEEVRP